MKLDGFAAMGAVAAAVGSAVTIALAAPAHADPDTDFNNTLHTYGIYGQKDYNAWIAKIMCHRVDQGIDHDADQMARFVSKQLPRKSDTAQAWKFVGLAVTTYCPHQQPVLQRAAEQHSS